MIGWYSSAGYFSKAIELKNLSDITFLDKNKLFIMPEMREVPSDDTDLIATTVSAAFDLIDRYYGPDWYSVSTTAFSDVNKSENGIDNVKTFIPGWDLAYPNTNSFFYNNDNNLSYFGAVYIYKWKKVITLGTGGLSSYNVNSDGSLTYKPHHDIEFNALRKYSLLIRPGLGTPIMALAVPYTGIEVLKNPENVLGIFVFTGYDSSTTEFAIMSSRRYSGNDLLENVIEGPDFVGGEPPLPPPEDPFGPGGNSKPGDLPPGSFDDNSDPIPDSPLPTLSAANTGFTRIYNPTLSQVQDLARYLWTDESVIETIWNHIKQFFENPMEAIIGFNLVPVKVPDGGTVNFALMYIDTGVSMNVAANQFVDCDCGSVKLERYYGSALDQSPYTKVSCFLPYIGTVQLNTDEVMGTTLQVKYRVDIVSGSCVAKILVDGNVLYQYSGHCAINIPISSADFSSYVSAAISVAKLAIGAAVGGAMGAAAASAGDATQQTNQVVTRTVTTTDTARNPTTGRQVTTGTRTWSETVERPQDASSTQASFDGLSPANVSNTVGQIMASKPHVEHSGSFSGNTGYLGVRRPFLIIERPNMCLPKSYQTLNGFPSMITLNLSDCKGYTRVQQVQLTGMTATNPEQAEILTLLKSGVIL